MKHSYKTYKRQTNDILPHCERFAHLCSKQLDHSACLESGKREEKTKNISEPILVIHCNGKFY